MQKLDPLDRLYRRLADVIRREHPGETQRSLTIAEIYQKLVPYRGVRAELGFSELPEYEHTLLRLLAGERDYVRVDLPQVREELQRELRAPNPILGIYRDYAAVAVHLNLEARPGSGSGRSDPPTPPFPAAREPAETRTMPMPPPVVPAPPPAPPAPEARPAPAAPEAPAAPGVTGRCRSCGEMLPPGREIRFCPHCGESQKLAPCRACGTALEPEWKFCIRCGFPRRSASAAR